MIDVILAILIISPLLITLSAVVINVLGWPKVRRAERRRADSVSILIPARNEEENLAACLDSALRQGSEVAEILIYNDHSTDGTAVIISQYAERDERVKSVPAIPLEPGWCGKNFACAQLATAARSEWLLFIDADARLSGDAVARMLEEVEARRLTLLSCWPGLELESFWEVALMPLLNFAVFTLYPAPLALTRMRDAALGLAHGACLMFHRKSYEEFGGHARVRAEIFEDTMLAREWRAAGRRGLGLDGQEIVRVRMYRSFGAIVRGFEKNFYPAFRREISFWLFLILHALVFLLPWLLAPLVALNLISGLALAPLVELVVIILLMRLVLARHFGQPLWSAFLHPVGEAVLILIGLRSWLRCRTGKGVEWKGRSYGKREKAVRRPGFSRK